MTDTVCPECLDNRWIGVQHPLKPAGVTMATFPCPACNKGGEQYPYTINLDLTFMTDPDIPLIPTPSALYIIRGDAEVDYETGNPLYWSNSQGWVDKSSATIFSDHELKTLNLPVGGAWEELCQLTST